LQTPAARLGGFLAFPNGLGSRPGKFQQRGVHEGDTNPVPGEIGGGFLGLFFGKKRVLLAARHIAQLQELEVVLFGEVDGRMGRLADLIGNGADTRAVDFRRFRE